MFSWMIPVGNTDTIDVVTINYVGTSFRMIECICSFVLVAYDLTTHDYI